MANNKLYGLQPKLDKTREGVDKLDRLNPYEFRKGMDLELTGMGVSRLAESTVEEREKATEIVLKNLEEHHAYYSALIQFEGGMNHGSKITETSFKKFLENYTGNEGRGDGMVEVNKEIKDDKMVELKEAIRKVIKKMMLSEAKDDVYDMDLETEPSKKQVKSTSKDTTVSVAKQIAALQKDLEGGDLKGMRKNLAKLEAERKKIFNKFSPFSEDPEKKAQEHSAYAKAVKSKQGEITTQREKIDAEEAKINAEIEKLTGSLTTLQHEEKIGRREVAKTMMDKDTHLEILSIIKEAGVNMMEGADGVKMYYEIAKEAYKEGFMAALEKDKKEK